LNKAFVIIPCTFEGTLEAQGINRKELAVSLGIGVKTLTRYLHGTPMPSLLYNALKIAIHKAGEKDRG